jgi:hypothetical protein
MFYSKRAQAFKQNGYVTVGMGKIYHPNSPPSNDCLWRTSSNISNSYDSNNRGYRAGADGGSASRGVAGAGCLSWSTNLTTTQPKNVNIRSDGTIFPVLRCSTDARPAAAVDSGAAGAKLCQFRYVSPDAQIFLKNCTQTTVDGKTWWPSTCDLPDDECVDTTIADAAVQTLAALSGAVREVNAAAAAGQQLGSDGSAENPRQAPTSPPSPPAAFFLAAGFHKPHPFWSVPQRFQDMYLADGSHALPLPSHRSAPTAAPDVAFYSCNSINGRSDVGGPNCDDPVLNKAGGASRIRIAQPPRAWAPCACALARQPSGTHVLRGGPSNSLFRWSSCQNIAMPAHRHASTPPCQHIAMSARRHASTSPCQHIATPTLLHPSIPPVLRCFAQGSTSLRSMHS